MGSLLRMEEEKIKLWHQICIDFRYFSLRPDYTLRFTDQNGQDVTGLVFGCALYYISLFKYFMRKTTRRFVISGVE